MAHREPIVHPTPQPTPTPPPNPAPDKSWIGNPSVSEMLQFQYGEGTTPSLRRPQVRAVSSEPLPPITGGDDTILTLTSDASYYQWGKSATLTATLLRQSDGYPAIGRPIAFYVNGVSYVAFTNSKGVATIVWTPFGVPDPGAPNVTYTAYAEFRGY